MRRNPFSSCCSTGCDRVLGEKYIEGLQAQIDGGLMCALMNERGDKTEILASFVAECLLSGDTDPNHIYWLRFISLLEIKLNQEAQGCHIRVTVG